MSALILSLLATPAAHAEERALIIAAHLYDSAATGWRPLHSHNDVPLVRKGLLQRGFDASNVSVLGDTDVTRERVLSALRDWDVNPGDHLYVHYSGHGQRVTDLNGDEPDGYDEAWAVLDTPGILDRAPKGDRYEGELHILDDDLGPLFEALRRKVGPTGSLAVVLDSCHSGTASRGAAVRGAKDMDLTSKRALRRARRQAAARETVGGGYADSVVDDASLAPMVMMSAARSSQPAREHEYPDGLIAGAYSATLAEVLQEDTGLDTWRAVHDRVAARMRQRGLTQVPQIEGSVDTTLFTGEHASPPNYLTIRGVEGTEIHLAAGRFQGVTPGAVVEVHAPGTSEPSARSRWGTATVSKSGPVDAWATLEAPLAQDWAGAPVFVTSYPKSDLKLRVGLDLGNAARTAAWTEALEGLPLIDVADRGPDFTVVERAGRAWLVDGVPAPGDAAPANPLLDVPMGEVPPRDLEQRLDAMARTKLLAEVDWDDPTYGVELQVSHATWKSSKDRKAGKFAPGERCTRSGDERPGGELRFQPGDLSRITVTLTGTPAHVTIVNTDGVGLTTQIYPSGDYDTPDEGTVLDLCVPIQFAPTNRPGVPAVESIKVFVSPEHEGIDFRRLLARGPATRGDDGGAMDLLWSSAAKSRGVAATPATGNTVEVTVIVEPPTE